MVKKFISLFLAAVILMASLGCSFIVFAANSVSVDSFVESVEELNEAEAEAEKTFEESVGSRVIVKALQKPSVYGNAEYFKGTYGKHIFQYATEEEALEAVTYYSSLSSVVYAVRDGLVNSCEVPYGEAMLGTQRAKDYIIDNAIPTSSVKVAVIDTGIDFADELFAGNERIVDSGVNVTDSGTENSAQDDKGHGSMCSEILMDNTADNVYIFGYKVLNVNGAGSNLWVATGIEAAIDDGVDIINLSLGGEANPHGEESSIVLDDAVRLALSKGIIVVAASGNDRLDAKYFSPANIDGVITVGAIDKAGNPAYFSNYGDCVDFVAPGVEISIDYTSDMIDGTSFSCPYIASEVCTLLTVFPRSSVDNVKERLSAVSVPYEHLPYHDGFHVISEDRGVNYSSYMNILHSESIDNKSVCYGNGMPQIDLIFNDFVRESTPIFSVDSGHYIDKEFDLVLSSSTDAEIYYTQDESYPTKENGIKYDGSIHLNELQSIRAVAFTDGKAPSYYSAREYRMEYHVPDDDFEYKLYSKNGRTYLGITAYNGTVKNIIYPNMIEGKIVEYINLTTPNVKLTSATFPDSVTGYGTKYTSHVWDLRLLTADGIDTFAGKVKYFKSLVRLSIKGVATYHSDCNVRELYLPNATSVICSNSQYLISCFAPLITCLPDHVDGCFGNCYSLRELFAPKINGIGERAFVNCYLLKSLNTESVISIGGSAFAATYQLKKLYCPNLLSIDGFEPFAGSGITYLYAPKLKTMSHLFGVYNFTDVPELLSSLIVSSEFVQCDRDGEGYDWDPFEHESFFYHHDLDIYGTPNTYAEEYANQFHLKFIPLPLMESEPDSMRPTDSLSVDVLGFNLEYQWYGTNIADNRLGEAIEGANGETFNPDDFGADYDFYYCVIKSSDGDYHKTLVTGDRIRLDVNGDGVIDIADISLLLSMYGEAPAEPFGDFNGDGVIDVSEISLLLKSTVYGTEE